MSNVRHENVKTRSVIAAMMIIIAMVFFCCAPEAHADTYKTQPTDITFGKSYSGSVEKFEKLRYNFVLHKAGAVTISGTVDQHDMTYGPDYYTVNACINIYTSTGKYLTQEWIGGSTGSQYFTLTKRFNKGSYYFTIEEGTGLGGVNFTFKAAYKGFPAASIRALSNTSKNKLKATWTRKTGISGYQVQIARDSKFTKSRKTYTVKKASATSKTISKLKKSKKYYVRVHTYTKTLNNTTAYSQWSKAKTITIRK